MNSSQLFKTWSSFKALYGDFEYLGVFIDDIMLSLPWFVAVAARYMATGGCKKREQYVCWKTAMTAHLLLLYHYSQTLPHLTILLGHYFLIFRVIFNFEV